MQEAVVNEMRARRLDLDARAKFSEPGENISETRQLIEDRLYPEDALMRVRAQQIGHSAKALSAAANVGQFDVG
jgi:hypothetical protein